MERETHHDPGKTPATMWMPAILLLAAALSIGPIASLRHGVQSQAAKMEQGEGYAPLVLRGETVANAPAEIISDAPFSIWRQLVTVLAAILIASFALFPDWLGRTTHELGESLASRAMWPIRVIHTGCIGDYVAWFVFGTAAYGLFLIVKCR